MIYIYLLLGLWRSWLGGGIGKDWPPLPKGRTAIQYAALALLMFGANWPDWKRGLADFVGLFILARGYIHGPMLRYPLGTNPKDAILRLVGGPGGGTFRYLAYATIRYPAFAVPWAAALYFLHDPVWWAPVGGAALIMASYAIFTRIPDKLPTFTTPGDEAANWGEIVGWTLMGAAIAGARAFI